MFHKWQIYEWYIHEWYIHERYIWECTYIRSTSHHTATHCNTLQHTATHCNSTSDLPPDLYICIRQCKSTGLKPVERTVWSGTTTKAYIPLQIIFHKRATKYRSLLRKMTYTEKGSYESSPPCTLRNVRFCCGATSHGSLNWFQTSRFTLTYTYI